MRAFLTRHWKITSPLLVAVGVAAIAVVILWSHSIPDSVAIPLFLVGIFGSAFGISIVMWVQDDRRRGTRADQISRLTAALAEALEVINVINRDVAERQASLARLEQNTEVARGLAGLSEKEAAAVRAELADTVRKDSGRSLRWQFLMNAFFFFAGVGVTAWIASR